MNATTTTDNQAAEERLTPIRLWAHANHGTVKRIADRLTTVTGRDLPRQTVGRWLHKDPTKRQQPSYGYGLLLERVVAEVQEEMRLEQDQAMAAEQKAAETPLPAKERKQKATA